MAMRQVRGRLERMTLCCRLTAVLTPPPKTGSYLEKCKR